MGNKEGKGRFRAKVEHLRTGLKEGEPSDGRPPVGGVETNLTSCRTVWGPYQVEGTSGERKKKGKQKRGR